MTQRRVPLFDTTEDQTLRIQKELAVKIGFNEAVVLMQIEYLISISTNNHISGNWWTYQTLEDLKENSFPWWSIATISRTLRSLKDQGLIFIDSFNKRSGDKTQWFALNIEKVRELGIKLNEKHPIFQIEKWVGVEQEEKSEIEPEKPPEQLPILQNGDTIFHFEIPILQDETTLPKTPSEISTKSLPPKGGGGSQKPKKVKLPPLPPPISIKTYQEIVNLYPHKAVWETITQTVGESPEKLDFWKKVIVTWIGCDFNPRNVIGMLDCFRRGELPTTKKNGASNGTHAQGKYNSPTSIVRREPTEREIAMAAKTTAALKSKSRTGGYSPQPEVRPLRPILDSDNPT